MAGRPKKYSSKEEEVLARRERHSKLRLIKKEELLSYQREWQKKNKETLLEKRREYKLKNKEVINEKARVWRSKNKERISQYNKTQNSRQVRNLNPFFKFKSNIRALISQSFKRVNSNFSKKLRSEEILGCSIEVFRTYILDKCPEGVTLKDFGLYGYHIDHIIPLSTANTEEDIVKLCHYTNLQPLWCIDNLKKSNKLNS